MVMSQQSAAATKGRFEHQHIALPSVVLTYVITCFILYGPLAAIAAAVAVLSNTFLASRIMK